MLTRLFRAAAARRCAVLAAALLPASGLAWGQGAKAAAEPAPDCVTQVELSPAPEGLRAAYRLCAPAAEFAFGEANAEQRRESWGAGEDLRFDGQTLSRADGAAFDRFELTLQEDARFYDRRYVALERMGAGWSLLTAAFAEAEAEAGMRFTGFGAGDVVYAEGASRPAEAAVLPLDGEGQHIVYVGPSETVTPGAITVIAGDDIPAWMRTRLVDRANAAVERFTARFGAPPLTQPTLFVSHRADPNGTGMRGGVADGEVIEIRLRGLDMDEANAALLDRLDGNIIHETAHFWIGHRWPSAENWRQPWMHEGGAEYVASRFQKDAESLREESQDRINECLLRDDPRPLDGSQGGVAGGVPYNCGFAVMLAAEAGSLSRGQGDIFDLWRAAGAAAGPDGVAPADFLAEAEARGGAPVRAAAEAFLGPRAEADWEAAAEALRAVGVAAEVRLAEQSDAAELLNLGLMPVLGALCRGSHGYGTLPDRLMLDTGNRCGEALSGDPAVVSVNGAHLLTETVAAYAAIQTACAEGGALRFAGPDGAELPPVACEAEVPPAPSFFEISALPDLPRP